jgi:hypothetical protein
VLDVCDLLNIAAVSGKNCIVTLMTSEGTSHSVEVTAESLYEAAASRLRKDGWSPPIGPATRFDIQVKEPTARHAVTMQQVQRWIDGATPSPNELIRKKRLKEQLAL